MNPEKIIVMHVRDSNGVYGAEQVILTLAKNVDKDRYHLILLCMRRKDGRSEELINKARELGINVISVDVNGRFDLNAIRNIRGSLKENRVSIIHSHDYKSDLYGLIASRGLGIRNIVTVHGSTRDSLRKKLYLFITERFIYRFVDKLIAVSGEISQYLKKYHDAKRIELIRNGIDLSFLENEKKGKREDFLSQLNGRKVFAVIGRLFPDKGHRYFLKAFASFSKDHPIVSGIIVGDGPSKNEIINQLRELKLDYNVKILGNCSDMQTIYENIDFLVIPSLREGLPYVLLEAMAYKVPVLASAVGDIPHLIKDGITGYLVQPGDADGLKKRMEEMITQPFKCKEMAEKAHQLVLEKYSADKMVRKTEALYDAVLAE